MLAEANRILAAVAAMWSVDVDQLLGPARCSSITFPRFVAMWLIRKRSLMSVKAIGRILGDRHHTTILHGCLQIDRMLPVYAALRQQIETIERELSAQAAAEAANPAPILPELPPRVRVRVELRCPACKAMMRGASTAQLLENGTLHDLAGFAPLKCASCTQRRELIPKESGPLLAGQPALRVVRLARAMADAAHV